MIRSISTDMADSYINISSNILSVGKCDDSQLETFFGKVADYFEKARKMEGRVSSDEDLKLSDTLRYYMRDTLAAKVIIIN